MSNSLFSSKHKWIYLKLAIKYRISPFHVYALAHGKEPHAKDEDVMHDLKKLKLIHSRRDSDGHRKSRKKLDSVLTEEDMRIRELRMHEKEELLARERLERLEQEQQLRKQQEQNDREAYEQSDDPTLEQMFSSTSSSRRTYADKVQYSYTESKE